MKIFLGIAVVMKSVIKYACQYWIQIIAIFFITMSECSFAEEQITKNSVKIPVKGYVVSCSKNVVLLKNENNVWVQVKKDLPLKGMYYLDDDFIGYGMCDLLVCQKMEEPYYIKLVEYQLIGSKNPPKNSGLQPLTMLVPVYQTNLLKGEIKVELDYFEDAQCQHKKTFSTTLFRSI